MGKLFFFPEEVNITFIVCKGYFKIINMNFNKFNLFFNFYNFVFWNIFIDKFCLENI